MREDDSVAERVDFCRCGDNEMVDRLMLAYLTSGTPEHPILLHVDGDAGMLIAYIADAAGWTEHGTSVNYTWLTEEGKAFLPKLRKLVQEGEA